MNITNGDALINLVSGTYPVYLPQVRKLRPNDSFAEHPSEETLALMDYAYVHPTPMPSGQVVTEQPPIFRNGRWEQQWLSRNYTQAEQIARFEEVKQECLDKIERLKLTSLEVGTLYTFPDNSTGHVQLRDGDRANLSGLRLRAMAAKERESGETFGFRTYENVTKMGLSADAIIVLTDIAFEKYMTVLGVCWQLKDAAENATDAASLPAVPADLTAFGI